MTVAIPRIIPLALLGLVWLGCQEDQSRLTQHLERGDAYLEEEKWAEAIIEYKNVVQLDPNNADAHYGLARAYLNFDKTRDGYWELRETVRLDASNLDAKLLFGRLSVLAGETEEAIKQANEVIEQDSERGTAYVIKAQALEREKKMDVAQAAYETAVEVAPDDASYVFLLANFHRRAGHDEAAAPLFVKLTEVQPGFASFSALGAFLAQERESDEEAEEAFREALERAEGEDRVRAYRSLAGFNFTRDRFEEAVATLQQGLEEHSGNLELMYLLARFYRALGEEEPADALIEKATQADPNDPRPYLVLSSYRSRQGDLHGALEAAESAERVDPGNQAARLRKAELLVDIGFREENKDQIALGRSIVDAILAKSPSNAGALFVKAKIDLADGDVTDAISAMRQAIDARPDWAQAHFVLGSALVLDGDLPGARVELARSLEVDATLEESRKVLAQVHAAMGEHEYAVEEGRRYLREHPEDIATRILVAQSAVYLGRPEDARAELEQIPEEQRNAETLFALGRLAFREGKREEARRLLGAADRARPHHPEILRNLLYLDRSEGRLEESLARVEEAVKAEPKNARLRQLKGVVALMLGRHAEAEQNLRRAVDLDPNDLTGYERLAQFYGITGRVDEMVETWETRLERRPEDAKGHHVVAVLHELRGNIESAEEHYEIAIRQDPKLGESKNNLAYLLADAGRDLDRALDLAQEAKALLPESANAADTLGWVLYKRGVSSAAVGYLKEAEGGMDPGDQSLGIVRHHLALAQRANGDASQARATVQRALADLETQLDTVRARGVEEPAEPPWAADLRGLLTELDQGAPTGG